MFISFFLNTNLIDMKSSDKKKLIDLLWKPDNITYDSFFKTLYAIGKEYTFLEKPMKNQLWLEYDEAKKMNENIVLRSGNNQLNLNYVVMYKTCFHKKTKIQKNVMDGMLKWFYNKYKVSNEYRFYYDTFENHICIHSDSENEDETEAEAEAEAGIETDKQMNQDEVSFILGLDTNLKRILHGKSTNKQEYDQLTEIINVYGINVQQIPHEIKEAKSFILRIMFEKKTHLPLQYYLGNTVYSDLMKNANDFIQSKI